MDSNSRASQGAARVASIRAWTDPGNPWATGSQGVFMSEGVSPIQALEGVGPSNWTQGEALAARSGFQFGVFDLDTKTGELRKEGRPLHLRNQPFQVLSVLLERAGDLVTREEIKTALWADNVDVDVEQGLNYCIKEIRVVLGDSAEAPRFIQTLPRRGYRFLADVRRTGPPSLPAPPATPTPPIATTITAKTRGLRAAFQISAALFAAASVFVVSFSPRPTPVLADNSRLRLVVLPFTDLSETKENYLADGLTDELISSLGRQTRGRLSVVARSSSLAYRNRPHDAVGFARELGASHFIEGTLRRDGGKVRVSVSLVRTVDETQVWTETYDRDIGDLLALEREVVSAIGAGVRVAVSTERRPGVEVDSSAYLDYLRGRFEWNKRTRESLLESLRIFESVTKKHPEFALGWSGLADSHVVLMDHGHVSPREAWVQARTAAARAVELDPGLVEAWSDLGIIRALYEWNSSAAAAAFANAEALNPNYATLLHWQSGLLRSEGRFQEALEYISRARDLDPLSLGIRYNRGSVLLMMARGEDALIEAESILSMSPEWCHGLLLMGDVLAHLNREKEAEAFYQKAILAKAPAARAHLAAFYSKTGRPDRARETLREMQAQAKQLYVPPFLIAIAAAGVDKEEAFRALEDAFEEKSPFLRRLGTDMRLDPIKDDPRFKRLVRVLWPQTSPTMVAAASRQ